MGVTCKICWYWCQWCGRKCKCWRGANLIGTMNKLYDLWMLAKELKAHQNEIYSKSRIYSPVELYDYFVNGVELPERNKKEQTFIAQKTYEEVKNFEPKENPNPTCEFDGNNGVWSRCIYCNSVKLYAPKVCPSYWLKKNKEDENIQADTTSAEENNNVNLDSNQDNNEHS